MLFYAQLQQMDRKWNKMDERYVDKWAIMGNNGKKMDERYVDK